MTFVQALVLGVVQRLTGFLPVSAAHPRIVPALAGWHFYGGTTNDPGSAFSDQITTGARGSWADLLGRGEDDRMVLLATDDLGPAK